MSSTEIENMTSFLFFIIIVPYYFPTNILKSQAQDCFISARRASPTKSETLSLLLLLLRLLNSFLTRLSRDHPVFAVKAPLICLRSMSARVATVLIRASWASPVLSALRSCFANCFSGDWMHRITARSCFPNSPHLSFFKNFMNS